MEGQFTDNRDENLLSPNNLTREGALNQQQEQLQQEHEQYIQQQQQYLPQQDQFQQTQQTQQYEQYEQYEMQQQPKPQRLPGDLAFHQAQKNKRLAEQQQQQDYQQQHTHKHKTGIEQDWCYHIAQRRKKEKLIHENIHIIIDPHLQTPEKRRSIASSLNHLKHSPNKTLGEHLHESAEFQSTRPGSASKPQGIVEYFKHLMIK